MLLLRLAGISVVLLVLAAPRAAPRPNRHPLPRRSRRSPAPSRWRRAPRRTRRRTRPPAAARRSRSPPEERRLPRRIAIRGRRAGQRHLEQLRLHSRRSHDLVRGLHVGRRRPAPQTDGEDGRGPSRWWQSAAVATPHDRRRQCDHHAARGVAGALHRRGGLPLAAGTTTRSCSTRARTGRPTTAPSVATRERVRRVRSAAVAGRHVDPGHERVRQRAIHHRRAHDQGPISTSGDWPISWCYRRAREDGSHPHPGQRPRRRPHARYRHSHRRDREEAVRHARRARAGRGSRPAVRSRLRSPPSRVDADAQGDRGDARGPSRSQALDPRRTPTRPGQADADLELSRRRADALKSYLTAHGLAAGRLETKGYGSSKPAASTDTPEGRLDNRRVELVKI